MPRASHPRRVELSTIEKHTVAIDTQAHEQFNGTAAFGSKNPFCGASTTRNFSRDCSLVASPDGFPSKSAPAQVFLNNLRRTLSRQTSSGVPGSMLSPTRSDCRFGRIVSRTVFGLDMLHHLATPMTFLNEVSRILVPGGRLILVEPWITPFSYFIFRFFHQERCDLSETPG